MTIERDLNYLFHILECTALIREYASGNRSTFMNNLLIQDAILRRLQVMAESTQRLSPKIKSKAPEIDWQALAGFRNVLVHQYLGGINLEQVWNAIENDLPKLEESTKKLRLLVEEQSG